MRGLVRVCIFDYVACLMDSYRNRQVNGRIISEIVQYSVPETPVYMVIKSIRIFPNQVIRHDPRMSPIFWEYSNLIVSI